MTITIRRIVRPVAAVAGAAAVLLAASPAWAALQTFPKSTWGTNGDVTAIATAGGRTVIGGAFTAVIDTLGVSHPASHIAILDSATGAVDTSWLGSTDGDVDAIAIQGNSVYIGGKFNQVAGKPHRKLAALDLTTGALLTGFKGTANGAVRGVAATPTAVFAVGSFTSVTDGTTTASRRYVAKLDGATGAPDPAWSATPSGRLNAVTVSSDYSTVYVGGEYSYMNSAYTPNSSALTTQSPAVVLPYRASSDIVLDLTYVSGTLYLGVGGSGGACAAVSPTSGSRIWYRTTDGDVESVSVVDGLAYCSGHYGYMSGLTRKHIAAVGVTYPYAMTSFAPNVNTPHGILASATDGANLFVGGVFTKIASRERAHFAAFPVLP